MNLNKYGILFPIIPFGGEDPVILNEGKGSSQESSGGQSNQPGNKLTFVQGSTTPPAGSGASSSPSDDDDDEYKDFSPKELRRLARDLSVKAKSAETERDTFKGKVDASEREKLSREEALVKDVTDRDGTIATLRATNVKLAIVNAINDDKRFSWHNAEVVAQQLNPQIVKVGDDGKVEGIAKELARVAKDHDYLLNKQGTQQNKGLPTGPTGFQPGQGGATQGGSTSPNIQELVKNYPALAARM